MIVNSLKHTLKSPLNPDKYPAKPFNILAKGG